MTYDGRCRHDHVEIFLQQLCQPCSRMMQVLVGDIQRCIIVLLRYHEHASSWHLAKPNFWDVPGAMSAALPTVISLLHELPFASTGAALLARALQK